MRVNAWRVRSSLRSTTSMCMVTSFLGLKSNEQMVESNKVSLRKFSQDRILISVVMILVSTDITVKYTRKMNSVVLVKQRRKEEIGVTTIFLARKIVERGLKVSNMEFAFKRLN